MSQELQSANDGTAIRNNNTGKAIRISFMHLLLSAGGAETVQWRLFRRTTMWFSPVTTFTLIGARSGLADTISASASSSELYGHISQNPVGMRESMACPSALVAGSNSSLRRSFWNDGGTTTPL